MISRPNFTSIPEIKLLVPLLFITALLHALAASTIPLPQMLEIATHVSLMHTMPGPQEVPSPGGDPGEQAWPAPPFGPVTEPQVSTPIQDANNWVVAGFGGNARNGITSGAGTLRTQINNFGSACCPGQVALNDTTGGGGSITNTLTEGTSEGWGIVTLELRSTVCSAVSDVGWAVANAQSNQVNVYWPTGTNVLVHLNII